MAFELRTQQEVVYLTSPLLKPVCHGFSTRLGGVSPPPWDSLNLRPGQGDGSAALAENYRRFFSAIGAEEHRAVLSHQVHETTVRLCTEDDAGKGLRFPRDYTADALITAVPALPLVVFSADCGIILLYDPIRRAVGAIHAGWRGCAAGIVEKTVRAMESAFGSQPQQLLAAIGPCIGQCCFETDDDVPDAMRHALGGAAIPYLARRGSKWHVDLAGLNRLWLEKAGIPASQIDTCGLCTSCRQDLFWSHRKVGDARGAQVAVIALPSDKEV